MNYVKRVKINTGYLCNANCVFCYYGDKKGKNIPFEKIGEQLDEAHIAGIEHVDFSGGESTIHKDFIPLIGYAGNLFKTVCTLTNGIKLSDYEFFKECVEAGLNEVLYSVHGSNAKNHDTITQVPGSFKKMLKSIENGKKLGVKIRFNVTVNQLNYKNLEEHANLFARLQPYQVNFIIFNEWCWGEKVAKDMEMSYSELTPYLKKAIDILRKAGIKSINVRYLPFCMLPEGYEKHITNHLQIPHDPYEWHPLLRYKFEEQKKWKFYFGILFNALRYMVFDHATNIVKASREDYVKSPACKVCKYSPICDGVHEIYAKNFGMLELIPRNDINNWTKIKDPNHYREEIAGD